MNNYKKYIGDGVYFDFDGYAIILTTSNGRQVTNRIVLEPSVYEELQIAVAQLTKVSLEPPDA